MKLRFLFLLILTGALSLSCNNSGSMEDDALKLIKMEKQIVDMTIQLNKEDDAKLAKERDSISDELQKLSINLQEKYKKTDKLMEFQKIYDEIKRKK